MVQQNTRLEIVDKYGQKLTNSGFGLHQIRKAIVGGLVRYERRLAQSLDKSAEKWRPLHEDAKHNESGRRMKKLLAKSSWFKKKKVEGEDKGAFDDDTGSARKRPKMEDRR